MLDNLEKYKVILASGSPRRRELMAGLGVNYEVRILPDVDESYPDTLQGEEIPLYIAKEKADAYIPMMQPDELIITADTIEDVDIKTLYRIRLYGWMVRFLANPGIGRMLCRCCGLCRGVPMKFSPAYA